MLFFYVDIGVSFSNFTYLKAHIENIDQENKIVKTDNGVFQSSIIFSSIYDDKGVKFNKYPLLKQHFIGWTIETKDQSFDDNKITFMDFSVDQKNEIRFMYILPFSKNKALVETTWLSKMNNNSQKDYDNQIKNYIEKHLKINAYKITYREEGAIPLFYPANDYTQNKINIGTAGGMTRLSTGYTLSLIHI